MEMFTYLLLNIGTVFFPLVRSFESKIAYYQNWHHLFLGIFLTGAFFLVWDHYFTINGIWAFNPDYLVGIYFFNMPLEEWLFFFTVPFACVFIYEVTKSYFPNEPLKKYATIITWLLIPLFISIAVYNHDKWYTFINFLFAGVFLLLHWLIFNKKFLGSFYLAYLFHLIPFFLINGILTYLPVVIYNNNENLGIRIGSIPVEDTVYSMLLLLMNITFYEGSKLIAPHFKVKKLNHYVKS